LREGRDKGGERKWKEEGKVGAGKGKGRAGEERGEKGWGEKERRVERERLPPLEWRSGYAPGCMT